MAPYAFNGVTIDILVEQPRAEFDLNWLFPKITFEQFMEQRDWMVPRFFDPENGKVLLEHPHLCDPHQASHHSVRHLLRQSQGTQWRLSVPYGQYPLSRKPRRLGL